MKNRLSVIILLCVGLLLPSCDSKAPESPPEPFAVVHAFANQSFVDRKPLQDGGIFVCQIVVHGRNSAPPTTFLIAKVDTKWHSYGTKNPLGQEGKVGTRRDRDRVELFRDNELWATYDVTREPFSELLTIGTNEYTLAGGRVFLVDFTAHPSQVDQVDTDVEAVSEQPDLENVEEIRLRLKAALETLATQDEAVRQFITAIKNRD